MDDGIARFTQIDAPPYPRVAQFFGFAAICRRRFVRTAKATGMSEERLSITNLRATSSRI
jgi:hypothetical protein